MREIKFRAWDLEKKKWIEEGTTFTSAEISTGQLGISLDGHLRVFLPHCYDEPSDIQHNVSNSEYESVHPGKTKPSYKRQYILMQFTGLKDKNGKEIYEGDIVKYQGLEGFDYEDKEETISEVAFIDGAFVPVYLSTRNHHNSDDEMIIVEDLEVIGNIYETPELLER